MSIADLPLCVDLDGSLTPVDTLHELLLGLVKQSPASLLQFPRWIAAGKSVFKREVAARAQIDATTLPYREELLAWLRSERESGRRLVLATASNRTVAEAVASHLDVFDEVVATGEGENLSGEGKRRALVARFGEKGFDYVGNDTVDHAVWQSARRAIVVGPASLSRKAAQVAELGPAFATATPPLKTWISAARIYQWVKNSLVFVPALVSHSILAPGVLADSVLAFIAFGLTASSVYVCNDLFDLSADRKHQRKRRRAFASGALSAKQGVVFAASLLLGAMVVSSFLNLQFFGVLCVYYLSTWAYSLWLKRLPLVDVTMLAGLYTSRILAGTAATSIPPSFWLLAFSIFMFLSLGIVKRYTELEDARQAGKSIAQGRGYSSDDLALLMSLGTSAGYSAIVVMALYINSADSTALYRHNHFLWLVCPLTLFWISRIWLRTTRGRMHDDPIIFALRDRTSLILLGLVGGVVALSL